MADSLKAFLAENAIKAEVEEYVASERFVDAERKPIPWRIQPLTAERCTQILNNSKKKEFIPGSRDVKVTTDSDKFIKSLVTECVVFPNLNDVELQNSYGCTNAGELIQKMLTPGEYTDLANTVQEVNGYEVGMKDKIQRAKN